MVAMQNQENEFEYEDVTYSSSAEMESDILSRESNGWELVSMRNTGTDMSGGCVGCISLIPIFFPFGKTKKNIRVVYRKQRT